MLLKEISMSQAIAKINKTETPHHKMLGSGAQGYALLKKTKTNSIVKVYGLNSLDNMYYQFIKLIEQHQDNPFFPRIYRHKVYPKQAIQIQNIIENQRWKYVGVVEMERLFPLKDFESDVIQALFANLGLTISSIYDLYDLFHNRSALYRARDKTPNETFAQALDILLNMSTDEFDLHSNNWMIRKTSIGPQLVILDPVYNED